MGLTEELPFHADDRLDVYQYLKTLLSQSLSLQSHLSLAQTDLLEFDRSVFGSHWRW